MGIFDFIKKDSKEKEHQQSSKKYSDMDIALGKAGQIDKNVLSNIMINIQDQKDLEKIALESTIDQARMWAVGALENEMIKNYVYGIMKHNSSDSLIRMAANQEYRDITDEEYHKLAEMFTERTGLPAWKCENMYVARMAVAEISDADVLNEIINGKNYSIEFEAKKRLIEITKE